MSAEFLFSEKLYYILVTLRLKIYKKHQFGMKQNLCLNTESKSYYYQQEPISHLLILPIQCTYLGQVHKHLSISSLRG